MKANITRRDFFKGSIVVAVGAMSSYALASCAPAASAGGSSTQTAGSTGSAGGSQKIVLHRGYGAAHGEKCFTQVVVATDEKNNILGVKVDDYQFMAKDTAGITGVPNSDAGFGAGYAAGQVLMSKMDNNDVYSALMKEKGKATQLWGTSMGAIEAYCVGKSASDLGKKTDAVSGSTLVDTPNYIKLIAQVAQDSALASEGTFTGDGADLKLGRVNGAAHGEKAFADAVSLVQGDTLVATNIDEFQFMSSTTANLIPVPNSDKAFAQGYAEGVMLASKSVNSASYSATMKEKAQATTPWLQSMQSIESYLAGQNIGSIKVSGPDAVSGSTLVDTAGYVKNAVEAAKIA